MPRRPKSLVLALDLGSSSTRAAIFDARGKAHGAVASKYSIRATRNGGAELAPDKLLTATRSCLRRAGSSKFEVIAGCAFWHGLLGLDAKRRPITPIYTWADARCRREAEQLRSEFGEYQVLQRTGCMLRFPFWPAKLRWLRRTQRALWRRVHIWVSPGDWIFYELFGELATSSSMASATGLFDQVNDCWAEDICAAADIRISQLPEVRVALRDDSAIRIFTPVGDGAAGNLGSGATARRIAAINLGTSAAVRVIERRQTRRKVPYGLFRYVLDDKRCVFGGAISNAGNLYEWCMRELRLTRGFQIARKLAARNPLIALPHLVPERAPDWPKTPATILGLNRGTTRPDFVRALVTSAFYQLAASFDALEQSVGRIERTIVSGGMTKSRDIIGLLADALGRDLEVASYREASLRGAAILALEQLGYRAPPPRRGDIIACDPALVREHSVRRDQQRKLARALAQLR